MSYAIKGPAEVRDYEARVPERPEREEAGQQTADCAGASR